MVVEDIEALLVLKQTFESNAVLQFTHETGINNKINFFDVHITSEKGNYLTSVFQKPPNFGIYLHYNS